MSKGHRALMTRIERGDSAAEDEFCRQFQPLVQSVLRQMTDDCNLQQDLSQEVLLTVLLRIREGEVREPNKMVSYIAQTARFISIGWFRRKGNQPRHFVEIDDTQTTEDRLDETVMGMQRHSILTGLLDKLNVPRDQEILRRSYMLGEDKASLCQLLELQDEHFDRVISRARSRLKKVVLAQKRDTQTALQPV